MNETTLLRPLESDLEARSDEELNALICRAKAILDARKEQQDKKAWKEIQHIAKSRGFAVAKKRPRGRPPRKSKNKE